jgi:Tfp pilus assembly protein PilO
LEVREQYQIKVPDNFLVLGNFDDIGDISRNLENIRKISELVIVSISMKGNSTNCSLMKKV